MSGNPGQKRGKGRGKKGRGKGRGGQPQFQHSESTPVGPGGLPQQSEAAREAASGSIAAQPSLQPSQPTGTPPQQVQAPHEGQVETALPQKHPTSRQKKKKPAVSASQAGQQPTSEFPSQEYGARPKTQPGSQHPSSPKQPQTQPSSSAQQATPSTAPAKVEGISLPGTGISLQHPAHLEKAVPKPPRRPDKGGTSGRPINLRVNFLPVKLPVDDIHHYDAEIKAEGYKSGQGYTRSEAPKIIKAIVTQYERENPRGPKLVYDKNGKNIYCRSVIPEIGKGSQDFKVKFVTDEGRERDYTVQVKWVSQVSLYNLNQALEGRLTEMPYDTMQAIEVVLRQYSSMNNIRVGSSFFTPPDGHEKDIGHGVQVWNGTFLSVRPTQWKMMLNIDTSSTAFYKAQPVLDFMCEHLGLRNYPTSLRKDQLRAFSKEMKTIKVETTHFKRRQKVTGLSQKSSKNETFEYEGKKTSVFDYFRVKYGITLGYPDLPCLKLGSKKNCVPVELCNIVPGQHKQGRLSAELTREMIRHTALPAPQRQQEINKLIHNANFDQDPYCRDFGISVGKDMVRVKGRVLDPPVINYGPRDRPCRETPRDGVWSMQQKPMFQAMELKEWAIISCEDPRFLNDQGMDNFIRKLVQASQEKQLTIHPSPCFRDRQRGYEGIGKLFGHLHGKFPNLQLIIVIFPGRGSTDEYYEEVKHYGDVIYGIRTQCLKSNTATRKADMQTMANICLKINAKLGGTTAILDKGIKSPILRRPVIIFGADVTHPSPRDQLSPSIAAVVASMDSYPNVYNAEVRVQQRRKEMIVELKEMVKILLQKFRTATGVKPERILFYRDGVGEGQFKEILLYELQAIQRACLDLHESFKPAITFIVVQKRHNARFFAENPKEQRGKSRNIPAGTVVDQQVCHPFEFDWYLCSHAGIQGTSKPTKYHVLYDDSNFKSDELQILTHQLCHTYVRCARAVSYPAPAYYAHHVAFRARYHLSEVDRGSSDDSVASGSGGGLKPDEMIRAVKIHDRMNSSMYFA